MGIIATAGAVDGVPSVLLDFREKPPVFLCLFWMGKKEIHLKVALEVCDLAWPGHKRGRFFYTYFFYILCMRTLLLSRWVLTLIPGESLEVCDLAWLGHKRGRLLFVQVGLSVLLVSSCAHLFLFVVNCFFRVNSVCILASCSTIV